MSSTYSQTIASARRQITNSSNAVCASKKRIYQANKAIANSQIAIANTKFYFVLSVSFLTNDFLAATCQQIEKVLTSEAIQAYGTNAQYPCCLTPQENLQQIMTHPFKTGLCPDCGHAFPKLKQLSADWNCLACGWCDRLFS